MNNNSSKQKTKQKVEIGTKIEILSFLEAPGGTIRKAAEKFGVSKGVVQGVKKRKVELLSYRDNNQNLKFTRLGHVSPVNRLVYRWFAIVRGQGFPISGPIVKEKAILFAQVVGDHSFKASDGWLESWRKRNSISFRSISGESGNVDFSSAEKWKINLSSLCNGYEPKNIFNMDETGYFFRSLPDKTLASKGDECKGGKLSKDCLTLALTCSMLGEKLPPLLIGKSNNPRCFRGVDLSKYPCDYRSSSKAWMTNPLFNEYLLNLNSEMERQGRKILLFIDNAPVHIIDPDTEAKLDCVEVKYFPPNLTSLLQPLDGGIIRSFKARVRKFSILKILSLIDSQTHASELTKKLNVLDAMRFVVQSWNDVTASTIQACFKNCGFLVDSNGLENGVEEAEIIEDELASLLREVGGISQMHIDEKLDCYETVNVDNAVDYLCNEFKEDQRVDEEVQEEEMDDVVEVESVITTSKAITCVKDLINYYEKKDMPIESGYLNNLLFQMKKSQNNNAKQTTLESFFN